MTPPRPLRSTFLKNWFAIEAIPIYVIVAGVLGGASWYTYRLAKGPASEQILDHTCLQHSLIVRSHTIIVIWTKSNPTPWNTVQPNEGTKLISVNQKFDKSWTRTQL
ncbi:hypothetical protein Hypma_012443 [Hypsizygus marmoreus]|uniref:Uncharacterized protein n=1 Tax=Hypsizygus marmoreus TaxID=39966 RepID=A0A369JNX3_HYPMA|nr:hypothetical protein Hypma_012443 [Hypsizygus marmoreus]